MPHDYRNVSAYDQIFQYLCSTLHRISGSSSDLRLETNDADTLSIRRCKHAWMTTQLTQYILKYFLFFNFIVQSGDTETDDKGEMEDTPLQDNSDKLKEDLPFETSGVPEGRMYWKK